jgi:hypothetical protein
MTVRTYSSPQAFKEALEQRLKAASKNGVDFARRRQLLEDVGLFSSLRSRMLSCLPDPVAAGVT